MAKGRRGRKEVPGARGGDGGEINEACGRLQENFQWRNNFEVLLQEVSGGERENEGWNK